jgi:hypothetical protein
MDSGARSRKIPGGVGAIFSAPEEKNSKRIANLDPITSFKPPKPVLSQFRPDKVSLLDL